MIAEYYTLLGMTSRQSTALQTHFIELYSAFKQGIRNLSLEESSLRCPTVYVKGDDAVDNYLESLHKILTSDGKSITLRNGGAKLMLRCYCSYIWSTLQNLELVSRILIGLRVRQWHTKINSRQTKKIVKQKWPVNEQQRRRSERKQPKIEK
jgi:hypothetical protein